MLKKAMILNNMNVLPELILVDGIDLNQRY